MFLSKLNIHCNFIKKIAKMSIFIQKIYPITGTNDWVLQNEDYDFHQEVARASFADMLHDTERNKLYEAALKAAINKKHSEGKKANVLDIGTGTGLLSMMAIRHGADTVTACEAFQPMSECAKKIIKLNGYEGKIKIVPKRSTDINVGSEGGDMIERCNILVTEVFDTELIGEGALSTFHHAHKYLLEKDCIVVPESATIYAQVVECPLAQNWNKLKPIFNNEGELLIKIPDEVKNCTGSAAVHDIQLSQLPKDSFNTIISPIPVLRFDWSGKTPFIFDRSTINTVKAENDGIAQAVFMWWELQMDTDNKIILSCAPIWAHPLNKSKTEIDIPWRDHWMQAIYYLPTELKVHKGQEINLISCHDEYSLWFNLTHNLKITDAHYTNPICNCGLHVNFARTRIGQMNDFRRNKKYLELFEANLDNQSCVLILGDGFYFALTAIKFGVKKMYFLETNSLSRRILTEFIHFNRIKNVEIIPNFEKLAESNLQDVNCIFGEPYFTSSILPWDNLLFLYLLKDVKKLVSNDVNVFPKKIVIKGIAVHFKDLYKIRSPVINCEGFLMKCFDELIEDSSNISDDNVEAQPLWEYPGYALSEVVDIVEIDIIQPPDCVVEQKGIFSLKSNLECNGIALWAEWYFTNSPRHVITSGPTSSVNIGEIINWDMYNRQGVCFLSKKPDTNLIKYSFSFNFENGDVRFKV